jgi:hypothetical protein
MAHEAGKGDKRRPEDTQAYQNNYDLIFKKKPKSEEEQQAIVEITNMAKELYKKPVDKQD